MSLLRPLVVALCFLALLFAGDRLLGAWLHGHVDASHNVHARLYAGRLPAADVLFIGSSRSREHFPAVRLGEELGVTMVNLGWGGLSSQQVEAILLDYLDRYPAPRVLVLEVTSPEADQQMIRNLRLFEAASPRLRVLVAHEEPALYWSGRLFHLLHYNNKLFFDMVRYGLDEADYLTEGVIPERELARIRRERAIPWEYREEDLQAVGRTVRTARSLGIEVAAVITPILPDYLVRLEGFAAWRSKVLGALPEGVRLWDYSAAVTNLRAFRDDLHLNAGGVSELLDRMRRDGLPGLAPASSAGDRPSGHGAPG
ncbi:MAG TPA: hypothetical protein VFG43_10425 [Geminicoccaceae bacterium]|nr:hypothetical protein [Geminicoccaceae bacterium]